MFFIETLKSVAQNDYFVFFISLCHIGTACWLVTISEAKLVFLPDLIFTVCTSITLSFIFYPDNNFLMTLHFFVIIYIIKLILCGLCYCLDFLDFIFFFLGGVAFALIPTSLGVILADQILLTYVPDFIVFALTVIAGFIVLTLMNIKYETSQKIKKLTHIEIEVYGGEYSTFLLLLLLAGVGSCALSQTLFDAFSIVNISLVLLPILGLGVLYYFLGKNLKVGYDI